MVFKKAHKNLKRKIISITILWGVQHFTSWKLLIRITKTPEPIAYSNCKIENFFHGNQVEWIFNSISRRIITRWEDKCARNRNTDPCTARYIQIQYSQCFKIEKENDQEQRTYYVPERLAHQYCRCTVASASYEILMSKVCKNITEQRKNQFHLSVLFWVMTTVDRV